jgi:hypothetical protein
MIRDALNRLLGSRSFRELELRVRDLSAFHILGIERREIHHAALLGWLLDPAGGHGLGSVPLRGFLMLAAELADSPGALDAVAIDQLDLDRATVTLEAPIKDTASLTRRLDVLVTVPDDASDSDRPTLIVEYKVDAGESGDQTLAYATWAKEQAAKADWTPPLMVYLCPSVRDEKGPAEPFIVMDYDAYCPWLAALRRRRLSRQADFLLDEFLACLARRDDVTDEEQDRLIANLRENFAKEIESLRAASSDALRPYAHVVQGHRDTLAALGISIGRRGSKGVSATVQAMRRALSERLDPEVWKIQGGGGSVSAISLPFRLALASAHDAPGPRLGTLDLQFFMDRPHHGAARLALEFIGTLPHLGAAENKQLRLQLAESLRAALASGLAQPHLRSGQTILSMRTISGIDHVDADDEAAAENHEESILAAADLATSLGDAIASWIASAGAVMAGSG